MALAAGSCLGPYEVLAPLGAGGMGEVYRARDPRLGREVAVKVLPEAFSRDAERLARFGREARTLAALSHPNILTVFDIGKHNGTVYIVSELLEGETLRHHLARRRLGHPEVVDHATQIARGLAAAGEKGIVHRDLKPANLFLTRDSLVKILDFGLAKAIEPVAPIESEKDTAPEPPVTDPGTAMGTVGYMSPEQVRGRDLDHRSDIFSFGTVLYEMLSGSPAFQGDSAVETLNAILTQEPAALSGSGRETPPGLERILRRCLEKRPERRFQTARDLVFALEAVSTDRVQPVTKTVLEAEQRSPYPGLASFTEADAEHFFGREAELEALWKKLPRLRLLGLIGPSGAGKTSFLRAGLLPSLPTGWRAVVCQPGDAPLVRLGQALVPELSGDTDGLRELVRLEDPEVALSVIGRWRRRHGQALLIVDQLEELFTLNPPEVQTRFAELLGRLAFEADVHVLLSMRDDFLLHCHAHDALAPLFTELTPLMPPTGAALRRALVQPAAKQGFRFEDDALIEEMLSEVSEERGALPLLAFAVSRLWERRDRERTLLTREAYSEIGGVGGALAQHAEATMDAIGPERQGLVREIFRNLVTAQGTRAVIDRGELLSAFPDQETAEAVLGQLIDARLVTSYEVEGQEGEPSHHRVEVVHESLLGSWPRLVRWQAQDEEGAVLRDQLKQAAHLWQEKDRSADLLWTGTACREFELWRERYPGALTAVEDDFAEAMHDKARRRKRLLTAGVATVMVALAGIAIVIAISRNVAKAEALRAEAEKLLALGRAELDRYPTAALAYVRESLRLADNPEARRFAVEVLWRAPVARILSPDRIIGGPDRPENPDWSSPRISPDGRWLALRNPEFPRILLVPHDGGPPRTVPRPQGNVTALDFGPQSDVLVTGGSGASLQLWSLPDLRELRRIELGGVRSWGTSKGESLYTQTRMEEGDRHRLFRSWSLPGGEARTLGTVDLNGFTDATIDPAGRWLAYASGHSVSLLPFDDPRRQAARVLGRHAEEVYLVTFFPGGDGVASVDKAGEIRLWPLGPGASAPPRVLRGPKTIDWLLAVDGGATHLARSGIADTLHLWDLRDPPDAEPVALKRPVFGYATFGRFDPSGRWLIATNSFTIAFWPVTGHWRRVLPGYSSATWGLTFTPDGRWLASCAAGEAVRLWPMSPASGEARALGPEACHRIATHPASTHLLVTTSSGGRAFLQPIAGGPPVPLRTGWEGKADFYVAAAFDARGRRAIACPSQTTDPRLRVLWVWDLETGEGRSYSVPSFTNPSSGLWCECEDVAFAPDGAVFVAGDGGVRRLVLPDDPNGTVSAETLYAAGRASFALSPDGRRLLVWAGRNPGAKVSEELLLFDTVTHASQRITTHGQRLFTAALDPSGRIIVSADLDGVVRAGPVSGGEPHLLLRHSYAPLVVAVSPDGRWIASVSEDGLSLWPMPDVTQPPLHTLPYDELMAKLDALTNLRVVRDPTASTGWKLDVGPFPGWKDVPTW